MNITNRQATWAVTVVVVVIGILMLFIRSDVGELKTKVDKNEETASRADKTAKEAKDQIDILHPVTVHIHEEIKSMRSQRGGSPGEYAGGVNPSGAAPPTTSASRQQAPDGTGGAGGPSGGDPGSHGSGGSPNGNGTGTQQIVVQLNPPDWLVDWRQEVKAEVQQAEGRLRNAFDPRIAGLEEDTKDLTREFRTFKNVTGQQLEKMNKNLEKLLKGNASETPANSTPPSGTQPQQLLQRAAVPPQQRHADRSQSSLRPSQQSSRRPHMSRSTDGGYMGPYRHESQVN